MAKDPAFLFYPGDWLGGTQTFSRAQKGAYMDLLMAQWADVALTLEDIQHILGHDFPMWEQKLKYKFEIESQGKLFYNRKLRDEMLKRKSWCQSRNNNKEGKNQYSKDGHTSGHMTSDMTGHMENENEDVIKDVIKKRNRDINIIKEPNQYFKFIDDFGKVYQELTTHPFNKQDKDFKIVKSLIDKHGYDPVVNKAKILAVYCKDCSTWFTKDGYGSFTIGTLSQHWNSILPQIKRSEEELSNERIMKEVNRLRERDDEFNNQV